MGRIAVSTVDFNAVADTVAVGVGRGWVGKEGLGFVGIVQAVTVGVCTLRVG